MGSFLDAGHGWRLLIAYILASFVLFTCALRRLHLYKQDEDYCYHISQIRLFCNREVLVSKFRRKWLLAANVIKRNRFGLHRLPPIDFDRSKKKVLWLNGIFRGIHPSLSSNRQRHSLLAGFCHGRCPTSLSAQLLRAMNHRRSGFACRRLSSVVPINK